MNIQLPQLPYDTDALEPILSKETLEVHYGKHHKHYVDTLNELINNTEYDRLDLEEMMLEAHGKEEKIFNNAAQVWNHTFFWDCMARGGSRLSLNLMKVIEMSFVSLDYFKQTFKKSGEELFGSGWVWMVRTTDGSLEIRATKDAENPLVFGEVPLLVCDVWEHAYYLDYKNDRARFLENFWKIVNWEFVEANLDRKALYFRPLTQPKKFTNELKPLSAL